MTKLHELRRKRADLVKKFTALATKEADLPEGESLPEDEVSEFEQLKTQVGQLDSRISRLEEAQEMEAKAAKDLDDDGDDGEGGNDDDEGDKKDKFVRPGVRRSVAASVAKKFGKGLIIGGAAKMIAVGGGSIWNARQASKEIYGENHPVTKALQASSGSAGGFIVPPDYVAEIIEILRARTVVRSSGPTSLNMPRGTLTLPKQTQAATANYGAEVAAIPVSEQKVGQIVATYKKLTALVPVSNDLMRYSDPSVDAMVRDDLVKVIARREDLAFIRGDGTADSPRGFRSFVQSGNVLASTAAYNLATVSSELGAALNQLETNNVDMVNPVWIMHPRSKNYMYNVQNSVGAYVFREEMDKGTLLGVPFKTTTQIPTNLTVGANSDCSEVYLVEMSQALLLDSMAMELSISREGTYVDAGGNTVSVFQQDQTLIRAITEHDFQMRQDAAVVVVTGVRWAPTVVNT